MILIPVKKKKMRMINFLLILFLLVAGFSQFQLVGVKPSDILTLLLFLVLLVKGKLKVPLLCFIFIFIFVYAWIIAGGDDLKSLFTNSIIFLIMFSLIDYLKNIALEKIESYLRYFNYSMFASNLVALIILVLLPQYKELVSDISSGGIRLCGFFTQANWYAFVLLVTFPIAVYFLSKKKSLFNFLNVGVFLIAILLTQSRGVLFSLAIGFGFIYSIHLIRSKKIKKYIFPTFISIALLFLLFTFLPEYLQDNFGINLTRFNTDGVSSHERNLNNLSMSEFQGDRLYLIEAAFSTIAEYPFGLGFQPHHLKIGEVTGVYLIPHNYFLSLFLYYGVVFGLFWIVVIYALLKKGLLKIYRLQTTPNDALFYLTIMMVSLSLFYLTHSSDWSYMYILIAFYIALLNRKVNKNETTSHR